MLVVVILIFNKLRFVFHCGYYTVVHILETCTHTGGQILCFHAEYAATFPAHINNNSITIKYYRHAPTFIILYLVSCKH